jgi:hypothetical protein
MRGPYGPNAPVHGYPLHEGLAQQYPLGRYRVIADFQDSDGKQQSAGDEWTLEERYFVPHDDELLLIVKLDDTPLWYVIPLCWERQAGVIENFSKYAARIEPK